MQAYVLKRTVRASLTTRKLFLLHKVAKIDQETRVDLSERVCRYNFHGIYGRSLALRNTRILPYAKILINNLMARVAAYNPTSNNVYSLCRGGLPPFNLISHRLHLRYGARRYGIILKEYYFQWHRSHKWDRARDAFSFVGNR